ncbi:MAG: hypothetical protein ABI330_10420 [Caldimonas sp.]
MQFIWFGGLARSAGPPAISTDAAVLVLGARGYETSVQGKNGFVCFVQRSWAAGFEDRPRILESENTRAELL